MQQKKSSSGHGYNKTANRSVATTQHRTNHAFNVNSSVFLVPPDDPRGRIVDLSDRLLICASSNMRNEVVVGGSDHELYAVDINDSTKKPITMYGKNCGHTDWVTSVTHMADGNILSGAMDGKLCLWSVSNRATCVELQQEASHPISKVVSDVRFNVAVSCSYDGNISLWAFGSATDSSYESVGTSRFGGRANNSCEVIPSVFSGHTQPVSECGFRDNVLVSGDKGGSLIIWDMARTEALHRFRAHPGAITAVDVLSDRNTVITCGTDGYVKVWDPRSTGSGLVHKVPAHIATEQPPVAATVVRSGVNVKRVIGGTVRGGGYAAERTTGRTSAGAAVLARSKPTGTAHGCNSGANSSGAALSPVVTASAISCLSVVSSRGTGDASYVITGSGGAGGGLVVMDARMSYQVVSEWRHHRNGVYSLCLAGEECVFSGDGAGNLLCHSLLESQLDSPNSCLRYGLGASAVGAVRAITCVGGKIVTAGEDGKVMILDYNQMDTYNVTTSGGTRGMTYK